MSEEKGSYWLKRGEEKRAFSPLLATNGFSLFMLHDGDVLVRKFVMANPAGRDRAFFICNYSQWVHDARCWQLKKIWREFTDLDVRYEQFVESNVLFLMNSEDEFCRFRRFFPTYRCELVNNCFTLSDNEFHITADEPAYKAIYNAKPIQFKRHYLAANVDELVLLSYAEDRCLAGPDGVNIRTMKYKDLFWHLGSVEVKKLINRCYCGLILSAVEGACYSSAEYLLCGIPVVSTVSRGGRSEYYTSKNSMLCESTPEEVARSVETLVLNARAGLIDRQAIRDGVIAKQRSYRETWADAVARMTGAQSDECLYTLTGLIAKSSKLLGFCHYWMSDWEIVYEAS